MAPFRIVHVQLWRVVLAFVAVAVASVIAVAWLTHLQRGQHELAIENRHLALENRHRIAEIQASRINSCRANYAGVEQVFARAFLRPAGKRDARERAALKRVHDAVVDLQAKCPSQTRPLTPSDP